MSTNKNRDLIYFTFAPIILRYEFQNMEELLQEEALHPGFSVDCVILGFHKKRMKVLLSKFAFSNYWQLPGGFMFRNESADEAVQRILYRRTGLSNIYLKQFYLFSDPQRTQMRQNLAYTEKMKINNGTNWLMQRFISLGYYAFVKYHEIAISSSKENKSKWFDIDDLPELYSDHKLIIQKAIEKICENLTILPLAYELLPEKFTMSELRKVYECFTGKEYDRRNFQRKILSLGILITHEETANLSPYNPPILYSFKNGAKDSIKLSASIY